MKDNLIIKSKKALSPQDLMQAKLIQYINNSQTASIRNVVSLGQIKNLDAIIKMLNSKFCKPEDMLITRGQEAEELYFVSKGTIEIFIEDPR